MSDEAAFRAAVVKLHGDKSTAYRNAWKRRGEQISIIANIARKVDRLESVADGAPPTQDESLMDTAVDLFVYVLKYQTFLADLDDTVAGTLFSQTQAQPPYSDGQTGFEALFAQINLTALQDPPDYDVNAAVRDVMREFASVEAAFTGQAISAPKRAERAGRLATVSVNLLGVLRRDVPERYDEFLRQQA